MQRVKANRAEFKNPSLFPAVIFRNMRKIRRRRYDSPLTISVLTNFEAE